MAFETSYLPYGYGLRPFRIVIYVLFALFFLLAITILGRSIYHLDYWRTFDNLMKTNFQSNFAYGISLAVLMIIFAIIGLIGVIFMILPLICCFKVFLWVLVFLFFVGGLVLYLRVNNEDSGTMIELSAYVQGSNPMQLDHIQNKYQCCGINKYTDYIVLWKYWGVDKDEYLNSGKEKKKRVHLKPAALWEDVETEIVEETETEITFQETTAKRPTPKTTPIVETTEFIARKELNQTDSNKELGTREIIDEPKRKDSEEGTTSHDIYQEEGDKLYYKKKSKSQELEDIFEALIDDGSLHDRPLRRRKNKKIRDRVETFEQPIEYDFIQEYKKMLRRRKNIKQNVNNFQNMKDYGFFEQTNIPLTRKHGGGDNLHESSEDIKNPYLNQYISREKKRRNRKRKKNALAPSSENEGGESSHDPHDYDSSYDILGEQNENIDSQLRRKRMANLKNYTMQANKNGKEDTSEKNPEDYDSFYDISDEDNKNIEAHLSRKRIANLEHDIRSINSNGGEVTPKYPQDYDSSYDISEEDSKNIANHFSRKRIHNYTIQADEIGGEITSRYIQDHYDSSYDISDEDNENHQLRRKRQAHSKNYSMQLGESTVKINSNITIKYNAKEKIRRKPRKWYKFSEIENDTDKNIKEKLAHNKKIAKDFVSKNYDQIIRGIYDELAYTRKKRDSLDELRQAFEDDSLPNDEHTIEMDNITNKTKRLKRKQEPRIFGTFHWFIRQIFHSLETVWHQIEGPIRDLLKFLFNGPEWLYEKLVPNFLKGWIHSFFRFLYNTFGFIQAPWDSFMRWWSNSGWYDLMYLDQVRVDGLPLSCCTNRKFRCFGGHFDTWRDGCKLRLLYLYEAAVKEIAYYFLCLIPFMIIFILTLCFFMNLYNRAFDCLCG